MPCRRPALRFMGGGARAGGSVERVVPHTPTRFGVGNYRGCGQKQISCLRQRRNKVETRRFTGTSRPRPGSLTFSNVPCQLPGRDSPVVTDRTESVICCRAMNSPERGTVFLALL